ncbi:transporter [Erythrobacter sp. T5W1-R]|uniref:transporter n=1 Tax=Erythrobacter sp. T5W1-R TaxID=3101752 RepID=UPI002AFF05B1|nr:transporter [Erythrobacter sp. T5W1-R]MEA1618597.1 transporter [Erythrobacter sp. T5W1-R]
MCAAPPLSAQHAPTAGPVDERAPICTDRPTKGTAACTVPKGMIQIESDAILWTRATTGGERSDALLYTNPTVKFGLTDSSDIQFNLAPLVEVRSRIAGQTVTQQGVGDLTVRFKQRLTDPGDRVQIAVVPFVKVPTAERGIGNGEWEGGLVTSVQVPVGPATLTMVPQFALLADSLKPDNRHIEFQGLVNLAYPLASRTTMAVELWTAQNWDPSGTVRQYSADAAISHLLNNNLQIDFGGNFGLNQATPAVQLYAGVSVRF